MTSTERRVFEREANALRRQAERVRVEVEQMSDPADRQRLEALAFTLEREAARLMSRVARPGRPPGRRRQVS